MENNNGFIQIGGEEPKKPIERYVALLQYKQELRGAEILHDLPKDKNEFKALMLQWIASAGMPEGTELAEIFLIDKSAVDTVYNWTMWQCSIEDVYRVCIDSWKIKKYEIDLSEYRATFNDFTPKTN